MEDEVPRAKVHAWELTFLLRVFFFVVAVLTALFPICIVYTLPTLDMYHIILQMKIQENCYVMCGTSIVVCYLLYATYTNLHAFYAKRYFKNALIKM